MVDFIESPYALEWNDDIQHYLGELQSYPAFMAHVILTLAGVRNWINHDIQLLYGKRLL